MKTQALALLLLTSVIAWPLFGQNGTTPSDSSVPITFRVYVSVSAPEMIKNVIESGMLRRLREFKDVDIVHSINPTSSPASGVYAFFVMAMQRENKAGLSTGYVISVVAADTDPLDCVKMFAYEDKKIFDRIVDQLRGKTVYIGQWLYSCGPNDLNNVLDNIVADIDTGVLEPTRQSIKETLQKLDK